MQIRCTNFFTMSSFSNQNLIYSICFQTNNNPSIKDVTALEVYILACLGFVSLALFEFALVLWLRKRSEYLYNNKMGKDRRQNNLKQIQNKVDDKHEHCSETYQDNYEIILRKVDHWSYAFFTVAFALYNAGYVLYYYIDHIHH